MEKLTQKQIESVVEWMNEWEQLKDTSIPIRFKEDFTKHLQQCNVSSSAPQDWDDYEDDNFDDGDWDEDDEGERRYEEECEYAETCTCGAWQFNSKGQPVHIADCFCGAQ